MGHYLPASIPSVLFFKKKRSPVKSIYIIAKGTIVVPSVSVVLDRDDIDVTYSFSYNGKSFNMVPVQGGVFNMGAFDEDDKDVRLTNVPVHRVRLDNYYIAETKITEELWNAVMGDDFYFNNTSNPVKSVSWIDCQNFITRLNKMSGQNFRLPTEAEWEYACRGGISGFGYDGDYTKDPNGLGVYDMCGRIQEWCQDWYGEYTNREQFSPKGPSNGTHRVVRGGGQTSFSRGSTTHRSWERPGERDNSIGLRLAMSTISMDTEGVQVNSPAANSEKLMENGHEYVDLGLSVMWASTNIGASVPGEYGDYFYWGGTTPVTSEYVVGAYNDCQLDIVAPKTYRLSNGFGSAILNDEVRFGIKEDGSRGVIQPTGLNSLHDAASQNWNGKWRMPTAAEWDELKSNCISYWTKKDGKNVVQMKSLINGNSIYLPAAGPNPPSSFEGTYGFYWASSGNMGIFFYRQSQGFQLGWFVADAESGRCVRPVFPAVR